MVDSKHQWKAWVYLLPAIILLLIFTVYPIINTVVTAFIYSDEYKPASIQVESVENAEGEYYFYFADEETSEKHYLSATKAEDGSIHLAYIAAPDGKNSSFKYDADLTAWTVTVDGKQYFVAATEDTDTDLFEATEANVAELGVSIYPAALYVDVPTNHVTGTLDVNSNYKLGVFKGTPEALKYILPIADDGYLKTTGVLSESAELWPETCKVGEKDGFKFSFEGEGYKYYYLTATVNAEGAVTMDYSADSSSGCGFYYNAANKAWVCLVGETEYYLGLDGIDRVSIYPLSEIADENAPAPAAMYRQISEAGEANEFTKLDVDDAYRIGAHRAGDGVQYYVTTGASNKAGIMLTDDQIYGESFKQFGINNFVRVLTSKGSDFMVCLRNTFILTIITVPLSTVLALLIAVGLNSIKAFQRILQTIFFLPYVTNSIAIGMVFAAMFNIVGLGYGHESVGIINNILGLFGIERINWINPGAPEWASFTALIVYIVWNALPFKILILLGGLQSINKQYYDAAKIDSTPKWRVLTRITVPLLSPMLTYTIITSFIGGFKEYSSVVGIFGEEKAVPGGANMNTIVGHIQNHLTETQDYGLAGAAALMLFVIIFIVTMINLRISKKSTHY